MVREGAARDGTSRVDAANKGSDRVGIARESAPAGTAKEIGTAKEVGTLREAVTVKEGDKPGSGMAFNTASGLDKTGPRTGSNGLRGSVGVVVVGDAAFAVELVTVYLPPVDRRAPIGDSTSTSGDKRFTIGLAIELGETIGGITSASGDN